MRGWRFVYEDIEIYPIKFKISSFKFDIVGVGLRLGGLSGIV